MTGNEVAFVVAVSFTAGHVTAWLGMWLYWNRGSRRY